MRPLHKRLLAGVLSVAALTAPLVGGPAPVAAAGETFEVVSVDTVGCSNGQFGMTVERANLDGGIYTVHTVVTVGGLIYMNESASISVNGLSGWSIFDNFSYGPVTNPGTYPIPAGETMVIDFFLERNGVVLYAWQLATEGCDSFDIIYNGPRVALPTRPELPPAVDGSTTTTTEATTTTTAVTTTTTATSTTMAPTTTTGPTTTTAAPTTTTTTTRPGGTRPANQAPPASPVTAAASYTG
jgi:hypothetical protein